MFVGSVWFLACPFLGSVSKYLPKGSIHVLFVCVCYKIFELVYNIYLSFRIKLLLVSFCIKGHRQRFSQKL